MYTALDGRETYDWLDKANPFLLAGTELSEPVAEYDITYCLCSHDKAIDFDPDWDGLTKSADIVFHEGLGWTGSDKKILNKIAGGNSRALNKNWPDKTSFSYRTGLSILNTKVRQELWDITPSEMELHGVNKLKKMSGQVGYRAMQLAYEGKISEAIKLKAESDALELKSAAIRDSIGVQRLVLEANAHAEKLPAKNTDGKYALVAFAGLEHIFQAILLGRNLAVKDNVTVGAANAPNQIESALKMPYGEFLATNTLTPETVAKKWAANYIMNDRKGRQPTTPEAVHRLNAQEAVSGLNPDEIKQFIVSHTRELVDSERS